MAWTSVYFTCIRVHRHFCKMQPACCGAEAISVAGKTRGVSQHKCITHGLYGGPYMRSYIVSNRPFLVVPRVWALSRAFLTFTHIPTLLSSPQGVIIAYQIQLTLMGHRSPLSSEGSDLLVSMAVLSAAPARRCWTSAAS